MGLIRLYITLIIVVGHMHTWYGLSFPLLGMVWSGGLMGMARVHVYFLQSGFLTQRQFMDPSFPPGGTLNYYHNRLTRIYPQYFVFLLLTVAIYAVFKDGHYLQSMQQKGASTFAMAFANLFAINLPTLRLWDMDASLASGYLLLPQAFTLTLQFGFILLAPLVLVSGRRLLAMAFLCTSVMLYYYVFTTLVRNFFVTELAYFWFGAAAARLCVRLEPQFSRQVVFAMAAAFILPTVIIALWYANLENVAGLWPTFALFNLLLTASMIPAYLLSRGSAIDRFFSETTYSLYLCHMLIAYLIKKLVFPAPYAGLLALTLSLALAVAIAMFTTYRRKKAITVPAAAG